MSVLCEAAEEGSISRCRQLLAAGSDVGEKDEKGWTPLMVLPHLQGNIEIGRHKDRNAEVGNTKHRIY